MSASEVCAHHTLVRSADHLHCRSMTGGDGQLLRVSGQYKPRESWTFLLEPPALPGKRLPGVCSRGSECCLGGAPTFTISVRSLAGLVLGVSTEHIEISLTRGCHRSPGRGERELVSRSWCHRPGRRKVLEFRVALSEAFPALASSPAFRACSRPAISESTQTSHRTHYSCTPQETAHTSPTAAVTQRAAAREGRISPPDAPTPTTLTITTVTIYD